MLKGSSISVWIRNIELALIGIFVGLIGVYYADKEMVTELGFFYGYSPVVWGAICLQVRTFAINCLTNAPLYIMCDTMVWRPASICLLRSCPYPFLGCALVQTSGCALAKGPIVTLFC